MRLLLGFLPSILVLGAAAPTFRLPQTARPARYELELTIVPRASEFQGVVRLSVVFLERAKSLWLNSKDLAIEKASVTVNGTSQSAKTTVSDEFLELEFEQEIAPGPARIEIAYRGQLRDKANSGLYRKSSGTDWYAYTTFTPIDARRAFPCFDEPGYKAPWRVVLHVPQSDTAASNAHLVHERNEPGGMKRVEFAETKPIASEVIAMAVGPFDVVDAGRAGANRIPVRILAPRGRGVEAGAAKQATQEILSRLEQYTGIVYPWDKLDHVAVLDMPFGAVENPGLITYRDGILLAKPERDTPERQRGMRGTMAHELAHQWFGNLVTQAWWDDVWLSEGFATWLGVKTSDLELPAFERSIAAVNSRTQIMRVDSSVDTRPVRLAMTSRADMARVYGGMVYQKGAAVLNMVEQWLGAEAFRRGLHAYLSEHALANATTDDLAAALKKESGVDVSQVLHSFLDQPGFPWIHAEESCAFGSNDAGQWTIPLCVHGTDGASQCSVLGSGNGRVALASCPAWVWPNRGGAGYFRVRMGPAMLESIVNRGWDQLSAPEKLSVIEDAADLVSSHRLDVGAVLKVLPGMARDSQPAVVNAAYRLLLSVMTNAAPEDRAKADAIAKQLLSRRGR
jgi:alanyl aminopeptidase